MKCIDMVINCDEYSYDDVEKSKEAIVTCYCPYEYKIFKKYKQGYDTYCINHCSKCWNSEPELLEEGEELC